MSGTQNVDRARLCTLHQSERSPGGRDRATRYGCRNGRRAIRCITSAHFYGLGRRYFASKSCARPAPEARSRTANAPTFPALFRHDLLPASSDTAPARIRDAEPTEANIRDLVYAFYDRVRADPLLGPVFDAKLDGRWDTHLPKMVSFWSSLVLGTRAIAATCSKRISRSTGSSPRTSAAGCRCS
jgi:hypothetical protein